MPLMQPLPSSSLTLRQVRYFVAVAEAGKVASAATTIGISPSAITEAVQELEALTGVQLITRHRNGVKLTYDGYVFLQHCRNILSAVSAATYAVGAGQTQLKGRLVLASTITVAGYFLATPLARFRLQRSRSMSGCGSSAAWSSSASFAPASSISRWCWSRTSPKTPTSRPRP
jgi:DNA-binding transcriptional LysR family regulator